MIMSTFIEGCRLVGQGDPPVRHLRRQRHRTVEEDYRAALDDSDVRTGLAVRGETVATAGTDVDRWLRVSQLTT